MPLEPDDPQATSPSLIHRARREDQSAWRRLCEVYMPLVDHWARRAGLQAEDAADICQEVFRTVAGRLQSFRKDRPDDTFRGWLRNITRNKLGDFIRAARNRPTAEGGTEANLRFNALPDLQLDSEADPEFDEEATVFSSALKVLRGEFEVTTWQAFWMATVDELPHDVIAEQLGITRQAVRQAKYRVLRRLREELREDDLL